ncbi:MAG: sulfopyruvate decarboxylase [Deltaproteobacteria bacterium]|nr:sulfopyruvate decarboxylase [Deltaproteobacteria bacterium]
MEIEKARAVVDGLKEAGVNFAVGLPDSQFYEVYELITQDPFFKYVGVGNEGEGPAVAMGAWFGGKKPVLLIATSGLLVATFSLARLHLKEVPLLMVIPYRGDLGDPRWMGIYKKVTEPMLKTMDIPYEVVRQPAEIKKTIVGCQECTETWLKPVAVLITGEALW